MQTITRCRAFLTLGFGLPHGLFLLGSCCQGSSDEMAIRCAFIARTAMDGLADKEVE